MLLNEIATKVGMTKRAIKYYEEKNLLSVKKDENGYRNYTDEDVEILRKISLYRKLGISINDIKSILKSNDRNILTRIYKEKLIDKKITDAEIEALKQYIDDGDVEKVEEQLDYQSIMDAIDSLMPGEWSNYFKAHFKPFLNVRLRTNEQKEALQNLLDYCENTTIKVPLMMRIGIKITGMMNETKTCEEMISYYRDMDEDEYNKLKEKVLQGVKIKSGIMKYHPSYISQRKMQKELQNKGYNDIFIPNLMKLSPEYKEYKDALDKVNDKMCYELGLYYDVDYNLMLKK